MIQATSRAPLSTGCRRENGSVCLDAVVFRKPRVADTGADTDADKNADTNTGTNTGTDADAATDFRLTRSI